MDLYSFFLPAALMGVGIAIDVTIATVSKFRDRNLSARNWTLPITFTHIAFPALGYYLFWGLSEAVPVLAPILGIIGFFFVMAFVYEVIAESAGIKPIFGITAWISERFGLEQDDSRRFVAILAVSWDALWSGPAKAAQAEAGGWNSLEVSLSFLIAGIVVAIIAQLALLIARVLQRQKFHSAIQMAGWFFWGKLVELSVIGGFGVLSLRQGLADGGNLYVSIAASTVVVSYAFAKWKDEIFAHELEGAEEAIKA
jgi:hypothetical protein